MHSAKLELKVKSLIKSKVCKILNKYWQFK